MKNKLTFLLSSLILVGLLLVANSSASAQGRGRGNARGGAGSPNVNRPNNPDVDFGLGTAAQRSGGRSEGGLSNADKNSNGRSTEGINRAGLARENALQADRELQQNPNIPDLLKTNVNDLRERYRAALTENPNLKFGQFIAANMLAQNLSLRFPNVTTDAILKGLAEGDSFGQALKKLGVSSSEARDAEREMKRIIKESKSRS
jgi:hypothetical protein